VPVLGIVENMSFFIPEDEPEKRYPIFGSGGAKDLAQKLETNLIAELPLIQGIREAADIGRPAVLQENTLASNESNKMIDAFLTLSSKLEK